jgi:TorA maturation chaperone TorD
MATVIRPGLRCRAKLTALIWKLDHSKAGNKPRVFQRSAPESSLNLVVRTFTFMDGRTIAVKLQAPAMVDFMRALRDQAGRAIGVTVSYTSVYSGSFRTHDQQKWLYTEYKAGRGHLAAPPYSSWHEAGLAVDLLTPTDGQRACMKRHGFMDYEPNDPPHFSDHVDTATDRVS